MLHPQIQIARSHIAGRGLIATAFIPAQTILWWADGSEACFSYDMYLRLPPEMRLLCYQEYDQFVLLGDNARYTNHCCDPTLIWRDDDTNVASRDLYPGDEITYDYATTETDPRHRGTWRCSCGSPRCRGTITPNDCLSETFQAQYPVLPSWTRAFIAEQGKG